MRDFGISKQNQLIGGLSLNNHKETPEEKRERLRQSELKNNPTGSLHDALNRGDSGNLTDLAWAWLEKYGDGDCWNNSWVCFISSAVLKVYINKKRRATAGIFIYEAITLKCKKI